MGVGMVMRGTERRRIDQLGGLFASMPAVSACILLASIAIAGSPPFSSFHSEWLILSGGLLSAYPAIGYLAFFTPLLTAGYALWLSLRLGLGSRPPGLEIRPVPRSMLWSSRFLVALSLVIGIYPSPIYRCTKGIIAVLMSGGAL